MAIFACPYLNGDVELTDERASHIIATHPDLPSEYQRAKSKISKYCFSRLACSVVIC
jgi:hypothetical protein